MKKQADKTSLVQVQVPSEVHRELKVKAASQGRTMSDIVRDLLFGWLINDPPSTKQR